MEQIRHNFFSLFRSKYFLTTFLMLMGIMTAFFLFFSLYSYRNTKNILQQEALSAGEYNIELARQNVENYLEDCAILRQPWTPARWFRFSSLPKSPRI